MVTALKDMGYGINKSRVWLFKCNNCGREFEAPVKFFVSGAKVSCGCIKSKGEEKIQSLLEENSIPYIREASFDNCRFPISNRKARFDFYVNNKYLIEFDGRQHFMFNTNTTTSWNNEENFLKTQERDAFKNNWCKENNIILIRIPYTHYKNLCIEDLLPETSQFIYDSE